MRGGDLGNGFVRGEGVAELLLLLRCPRAADLRAVGIGRALRLSGRLIKSLQGDVEGTDGVSLLVRAVPRERRASSSAAGTSIETPNFLAERRMISASSCGG